MSEHTLHIDESQRQMILMAIAHLAVERPGWNKCLTELALTMDNSESWKRRQVEALHNTSEVTVPKGQPVMFTRFKRYHLDALRQVVLDELASAAAADWIGYHEHICGTGEKESHFEDGFKAGWEALLKKLSSKEHERDNTRPKSGPKARRQNPTAE